MKNIVLYQQIVFNVNGLHSDKGFKYIKPHQLVLLLKLYLLDICPLQFAQNVKSICTYS
jgi:hypothetical protein